MIGNHRRFRTRRQLSDIGLEMEKGNGLTAFKSTIESGGLEVLNKQAKSLMVRAARRRGKLSKNS